MNITFLSGCLPQASQPDGPPATSSFAFLLRCLDIDQQNNTCHIISFLVDMRFDSLLRKCSDTFSIKGPFVVQKRQLILFQFYVVDSLTLDLLFVNTKVPSCQFTLKMISCLVLGLLLFHHITPKHFYNIFQLSLCYFLSQFYPLQPQRPKSIMCYSQTAQISLKWPNMVFWKWSSAFLLLMTSSDHALKVDLLNLQQMSSCKYSTQTSFLLYQDEIVLHLWMTRYILCSWIICQ